MLRKTVIPVAGFGTRMLPAAKALPKELLPVLDKPTIQYVVEEAAAAGIDDVLLITSRDKRAIEDHFDRNADLEQRLHAGGKSELLAGLRTLMAKVQVQAVRQSEQLGLGHAVLQARRHVGDQPFLCQLGDALFSGADVLPARQLADAFARFQTPVIGLEEVPPEKVGRYGIAGGVQIEPGVLRIESLVEKPRPEQAPSRLAIAARYVLTPDIFECLEQTAPGKGGEIQLTDAIAALLARRTVHGIVLQSQRHDIGNPVDWLKTNLLLARRNPAVWEQIAPLLRQLI